MTLSMRRENLWESCVWVGGWLLQLARVVDQFEADLCPLCGGLGLTTPSAMSSHLLQISNSSTTSLLPAQVGPLLLLTAGFTFLCVACCQMLSVVSLHTLMHFFSITSLYSWFVCLTFPLTFCEVHRIKRRFIAP